MPSELPEAMVLQVDRDAADDMLFRLKGYGILLYNRAACIADDGPVRQAFAAHRQNALTAAGVTEMREAARELVAAVETYRHDHDLFGDGSAQAGRAWDLMRRAKDHAKAALQGSSHE